MDINSFINFISQNPEQGAKLLGIVIAVYVALRSILGGYSRELWFKESKFKAKVNANTASSEEISFIKRRRMLRWIYNIVSLTLIAVLPFFYRELISLTDNYIPVVLSHWREIIAIIIVLLVIKTLNRLMNLELLAKKLKASRKDE